MPRSPRYIIRRRDQLRVLTSPLCQLILDRIRVQGPSRVRDLARALGKPPDGLYYSVRKLERVGLLVATGRRRAGTRYATVYDAPGRRVSLRYDPGDPENVRLTCDAIASMLRLARRDFAAAFRPGTAIVRGRRRNLWGARTVAWLTADEVEAVNRLLHQLLRRFTRSGREGRGDLHALTWVLSRVPVESEGRKEC